MKQLKDLVLEFKTNKDTCVVIGCGMSAKDYVKKQNEYVIGVNDVGLIHEVNLLLLVDDRQYFADNRVKYIKNTKTDFFITVNNYNWNFPEYKTLQFELGRERSFANIEEPNIIDYAYDSPYMAIQLAIKLGFKKIHLIGIDYTQNHFYANDGFNRDSAMDNIQNSYKDIYDLCLNRNIEIYNLSEYSKLMHIKHLK